MAETKRITPAEVVEAYAKTGLGVTRGEFHGDIGCVCGFVDYAIADFGSPLHEAWPKAMRVFDFDHRWGFADGFDGLPPEGSVSVRYLDGHKDGRAAWEAVKEAACG